MNENVTKKTPKRRRWIARLLASALCILLASSLLFIGVVAENIVLSAQFSGNYYVSVSSIDFLSFIDLDTFYYLGDSYLRYQDGDTVVGSRGFVWNDSNSSCYGDGNIYISTFSKLGSAMRWTLYTVGLSSFDSITSVNHDFASSTSSVTYFGSSSAYSSGTVYAFVFYKIGSDISVRVMSSASGVLSTGYRLYLSSDFSFTPSMRNSSFVYGDFLVNLGANICFNLSTNQFVSLSDFGLPSSFSAFAYDGALYALTSDSILMCDDYSFSFRNVGSFDFVPLAVYAENDVVTAASSFSAFNLNYTVYTGIDGQPPPESSDETTESSPPESSDETSDPGDIPEGYTKIWRTSFDSGGTYSSRVIDALDLREVTSIRAFFGSFPSSESGIESDDPIPLTLELMNGDSLVDTVQYNFYAFGFSTSSLSSYNFPDFVGDWFVISVSDITDLYFAENCPYGSVLLNSSLPASDGGVRIGINLTSPDSYFILSFQGSDLFGVSVYNANPMGNFRQFDFGVKAYKKFSLGQYGNVITSAWYYPEESTSVKYTSSDVTEKGLYGIFLAGQSAYDTDLNMSRLEDISRDHELLESLAESIYGQYSFDSLAVGGFDAAISASDKILDSSGGSYILNYIFGMWTVHPFASAMIAIVGSLAIIGFIIRKM